MMCHLQMAMTKIGYPLNRTALEDSLGRLHARRRRPHIHRFNQKAFDVLDALTADFLPFMDRFLQ